MSVDQRIKITCDVFDCDAVIHCRRGLTAAREMTAQAGWVNTVHNIGKHDVVLQDFCPTHRDVAFDWSTWRKDELERRAALCGVCGARRDGHHSESGRCPVMVGGDFNHFVAEPEMKPEPTSTQEA